MTVTIRNQSAFFFGLVLTLMPSEAHLAEERNPEHFIPTCRLSVSFDLKNNLLKGTAAITLPDADASITLRDLKIVSVTLNGAPFDSRVKNDLLKTTGKGMLEINYERTFQGDSENRRNPANPGVVAFGEVSERGISLTNSWYPAISGLAYYKLSALVPDTFTALSEADEIIVQKTNSGKEYTFIFSHPLTGINLVAGDYREVKDSVDGIDIYVYLFPEDSSLARGYINYSKKYLSMYNKLLVRYPYKRFSIVENILSTGYSMPTFTLLGQDVLRLPFIPETSLGHEIAHQWFGNYVYADFTKGNWLEAITTYLSDHFYEEQKGKGWEYWKNILVNFQSYVTAGKDFPLREFRERTDFSSAAIGYGKGAMLFHMLENTIGKEPFYAALRRILEDKKFQMASWADVQRQFEQESGRNLEWFFSQWLDRKGVPSFEVHHPAALMVKGVPTASFELMQPGEAYRVALHAKLLSKGEDLKQVLPLEKGRQYFSITGKADPVELIVDENYDVMRKLSSEEFPPVIARLLGDEKKLIIYPEREKTKYARVISLFKEAGFQAKEELEVNDEDIRSSSLLLLSSENRIQRRLFGEAGEQGQGFLIRIRNNPLNIEKVVAYAHADSPEDVDLAAEKIFHYGKYSVLRFEKGRNVKKRIAAANQGMVFDLRTPVAGVNPKQVLSISQIIDAVSDKPVILIGERHSKYEDHRVELDVIKGLLKKGRKIAIGMEMFQLPFQDIIDRYLAGDMDEREFLKKTEYFKRWGFDYNYYREIIEFAKVNRIPVIALNQKAEIVDKVAKRGVDSLTHEERKEIPRDMDMSDESYKRRLLEIYEGHPQAATFENFYQAQILWDETMAHSAARFMERHPDYQVVVLAGAEHIMYGSGIPNRIQRLTQKEYATLINGTFDEGIGTYVLFPTPGEPPFTAKLGVLAREDGGMVSVNDFSPDSEALKSGIKKGDIISSVDGWKVEGISDLKIALVDKKPGQTVSVKVIRAGFFSGTQELELQVTL